MSREEDVPFKGTEVAALVEDLKAEFRSVIEVVAPLTDRFEKVEERLAGVELEVRSLKDAVRIEFPALRKRLAALETRP